MPSPHSTQIEVFATLVRLLCAALEGRSSGGRLIARPLLSLIQQRLIVWSHRFRHIVERIQAGRPFPRRRAAQARSADGGEPPRRPAPPRDPLPRHFNWLEQILPDIVPHRARLADMLAQPEMAALVAAAPGPMGRILRPLCRMLGLPLPPILVRPRKPRARRPATATIPRKPSRRRHPLAGFLGPLPPPAPAAAPRSPPRWPPPAQPTPQGGLTLEWVAGRPRLVWT